MADHEVNDDVKTLHSMGYAQELARTMGQFSNFAISFSIICILSGGINSLAQGTSGAGGAALSIGWIVGGACALLFSLGMAQIASAFPTAGGLYHWSSILGGRGWGWATAWFNLIGLITVLAAINVGTYSFFNGAFGAAVGIQAPADGAPFYATTQFWFVAIMTATHALINHLGIKLTTKLTDLSGYLILGGAVLLAGTLFYYAGNDPGEVRDFSRLTSFHNYSGASGGDVWPETKSMLMIFGLGLLLPIYTLTGYDASAHTSEETIDAAKRVPKGIIHAVFWASLFALIFSCAFVLAIPNMDDAAAQGWNVFFYVMDKQVPNGLKELLYAIIFVAQYLCGLATVTSISRMIFAFARDKGLPFSATLAKVDPKWRSPVAATWVGAGLSVIFVAWADAYSVAVAVTSITLYLSYCMPIAAGLFAYNKSWKKFGPFDLGPKFQIVAVLCMVIACVIFFVGVQPPNDKALMFMGVIIVVTLALWFGLESRRFKGPPVGADIEARQKAIEEAEKALHKALD